MSGTLVLSNFLRRNLFILNPKKFQSTLTFFAEETENPVLEVKQEKPAFMSRTLQFPSPYKSAREVWVDNIDTVEEKKLGIIKLHPDVFAQPPRLDIIHDNVHWQTHYKYVRWDHAKSRAEMRGGGRKPWPQKGLGRARHGSIRSPLFKNGGICHGPRAPDSHFYMLPFYTRVLGLTTMLSVKLAQDDLRIVDSLEIPTDDPKYIEELMESRTWGVSLLMVDDIDIMPKNITVAADALPHVNLMPVYGLNVHSMLKHETLILTVRAAEKIEEKLVHHINRTDTTVNRKFKPSSV